jgi:hypothetical protein
MLAGRNHRRVPVVVGESLNCLGVLRSLAGQGTEMDAVATTRWCGPALPGLHHYLVEELARRSIRRVVRLWHGAVATTAEPAVARNARP